MEDKKNNYKSSPLALMAAAGMVGVDSFPFMRMKQKRPPRRYDDPIDYWDEMDRAYDVTYRHRLTGQIRTIVAIKEDGHVVVMQESPVVKTFNMTWRKAAHWLRNAEKVNKVS